MSCLDSIFGFGERFQLIDDGLECTQGWVVDGLWVGTSVDAGSGLLDAGEHGHELEELAPVLLAHGLVDVDAEHLGLVGEAAAVGSAGEDADAIVIEGVAVEVVLGLAGAWFGGAGGGDGLGPP
jgi:hypothetical protein